MHLAILDGWFDKGQHFELAAQMLPFKYSLDSEGATPPLRLSKSGMIVCHKVSPFASTTALSLDHAPEMKRHLGYIWNRAAITFIFCSYALLNVKLHPINSVVVLRIGVLGIKLCQYAFLHTCS